MNPIATHLEHFHPLSDQDQALVADVAVRHDYPRQHVLMREGEVYTEQCSLAGMPAARWQKPLCWCRA